MLILKDYLKISLTNFEHNFKNIKLIQLKTSKNKFYIIITIFFFNIQFFLIDQIYKFP